MPDDAQRSPEPHARRSLRMLAAERPVGARRDWVLSSVTRFSAIATGALLFTIVAFLLIDSAPALREIGPLRFALDDSWHPAPSAADGTFGLLPMLVGTLLASAGALALALPLGILAAVFQRYFAPRVIAVPFRTVVELLAGIPSVVYGFWGLVVVVPLVRQLAPPGPSLLAGALILALMILPTVALTADAALASVPVSLLRGASALGLSRSSIVRHVALPAARRGLLSGAILAAGRAIGETMAILMVCGNVVQVPSSVFDPVRTLTAGIALEMAYALELHRSALFVCGLVLMAAVTLLVVCAERAGRQRTSSGWAG